MRTTTFNILLTNPERGFDTLRDLLALAMGPCFFPNKACERYQISADDVGTDISVEAIPVGCALIS